MRRMLGWAVALSLLAVPAAAGDKTWTPLGGPGMPAARVLVDPVFPGIVYALVAVPTPEHAAGLWKSTDGGETWRSIQEGIGGPVELLAIDPLQPERLYAWQPGDNQSYSPQSRLWASEDGGDTWSVRFTLSPSETFFGFEQIVPSPVHEDTLYAWAEGHDSDTLFFRSTDGGATWQRRGRVSSFDPSSLEPLSHHPSRDQLEFLDGKALYVSNDGGLTWTARGSYRNKGLRILARSAAAPDRLYASPVDFGPFLVRSDDGGAHWRKVKPPVLPNNFSCIDVAVDPHDPDLIRVVAQSGRGFSQKLATSRDGGATWSRPLPMPSSEVVPTLLGAETLFAGSPFSSPPGLFKSTDGGETWVPSWDGIANGDLRFGLAAVPTPRQRLTLVGLGAGVVPGVSSAGQMVRSLDGGKTWEPVASQTATFIDLEIDAGDQILYALRREDGRVLKSLDRGLTWRRSAPACRSSRRYGSSCVPAIPASGMR